MRTDLNDYWKSVWFPRVGNLYVEARLLQEMNSYARVVDCVADFKEWASGIDSATYHYSRAADGCVRAILRTALGDPIVRSRAQFFAGYKIRTSAPEVGMKKILMRSDNCVDISDGLSSPRSHTARFCRCEETNVPARLRNRAHYHCLSTSCLSVFQKEQQLSRHMSNHTEMPKLYKKCYCELLQSKTSTDRILHYHCDICHKSFPKIAPLMQHCKSSHPSLADRRDIVLFGAPGRGDPFDWYSSRLIKREILSGAFCAPDRRIIRDAFVVVDRPRPPRCMLEDSRWRTFFRVEEYGPSGSRRCPPRAVLVLDLSPRLWIYQFHSNSGIIADACRRGPCYVPRVGFFTLSFSIFLRACYSESLTIEGARRIISITWASGIAREANAGGDLPPEAYTWVLSAVPSSSAIRSILLKTRSLFARELSDLRYSLAMVDSHVIRADGHFKAPKRILDKEERGSTHCIIAFLGCAGFLLQEVSICPSESSSSYIDGISPILRRRYAAGLPPPHFLFDNPGLIEGRLQDAVREIWSTPSPYILGGDPTHRKIEFDGKCDATHQDYGDAKHDYGYVLKRFGFLLPDTDESDFQLGKKAFSEECDRLFAKRHITTQDTYSALHQANLRLWETPPSLDCMRRMFADAIRRRDKAVGAPILNRHVRILVAYFATGRLRNPFPVGLRNALIDYHKIPFKVNGYFLPSGAVHRALRASESKSTGVSRRRKLPVGFEAFPAYATFAEYETDILRLVKWYDAPVRIEGRPKKGRPRRESPGDTDLARDSRYPMKNGSVLTYKLLDVIRRGLLIENCVYYFRHAQIVLALRESGSEANMRDLTSGSSNCTATVASTSAGK